MNIQKLQIELTGILNALIDTKATLQEDIPTKQAAFSERDHVAKELLHVHEKFKKLLGDLDLIADEVKTPVSSESSIKLDIDPAKILAITCRNAVKEKIDAFQHTILDQVTTGGPMEAKFYKELNPSMPDSAVVNIEKKIDKVFKEIVKKSTDKELIVLIGIKEERTDQFLFKSIELIATRTRKPVIIIELDSLLKMTENEVKAMIARSR